MCAAFIFFWFFVALIYILTWIKNNREYFIEKVLPTFLSKLVPSKSVLGAMITVNKASLMLYVMARVCTLFSLCLPADLGMVCDKAVSLAIPLKVGSTGMVVIGGAISLNSTIQATNGAHLSTMSAPVLTRTVSTPNPSLANKGHELSQRSYNAHSPLEVDSDSTAGHYFGIHYRTSYLNG